MADGVLQLPIDIIRSVFDQLRNDTKSLATCSLVCKAWEPASRSLLFRSVTMGNWNKFLAEGPHLTHYIVDLSLVGIPGFGWTGSGYGVTYLSPVDVSLLARMLLQLPALRRLHLVDLAYEGSLVPLPHSGRPSLDLLVFQNVPPLSSKISTISGLLGVIAMFSSIGHLGLIGDNAEEDHVTDLGPMDEYEIPQQVDIRSLELKHLSYRTLTAVTGAIGKGAPVSNSLETLAVSIYDTYGCVAIIGDFLRRFRHSIKHLTFDPMVLCIRSHADWDEWDELHLSECSGLTSLTLALELPPIVSRSYPARKRCLHVHKSILGRPLPLSLEQVTLRLGATKPDASLSSLDWAEMDRLLCRISSLKSVVIDLRSSQRTLVRPDPGIVDVEAFVQLVNLPGLRSQGILEFRVGDRWAP